MHPIDNLPFELISSVTVQCVDLPMDAYNISLSPQSPIGISWNGCRDPLILGIVSSLWRKIAHGTPQLWSNIFLRLGTDIPASRTALNALSGSLSRAKAAPISLETAMATSDEDEDCPEELNPTMHAYLTNILQTSNATWKRLNIRHIELDWDKIVNGFGTFSSLTDFQWDHFPGCPGSLCGILQSSTKLSTLSIHAIGIARMLPLGPRLNLLTFVDLELSITPAQMAALLVQCNSLERCCLAVVAPEHVDATLNRNAEPCSLLKLRSMRLISSLEIVPILDAITAPALRTLSLCSWRASEEQNDVQFSASSLSRSSTALAACCTSSAWAIRRRMSLFT